MPKKNNLKKYIGLAGILFFIPLFLVLFFGVFSSHHFKTLPYFGPEAEGPLSNSTYTIPPFAFQNQYGQAITNDSLKGKIWIAAFYALDNPNLDKITNRLLEPNFRYKGESDISIVVFSTNCDHDSPELLQAYVEKNTVYNEFPGKWQFLTGNQVAMQSYIRNGFLINDLSSEAIFRLVDQNGHIRGLYGNTEYHIQEAVEDIALLKKEIDQLAYDERKAHDKN
jgi:protein SCO1